MKLSKEQLLLAANIIAKGGVGRRNLAKQLECTNYTAGLLLKAGSKSVRRMADATAETDLQRRDPSGFHLTKQRILDTKPNVGVRNKLLSLRRGLGFLVDELSASWGLSAETIAKHARKLGMLKWVEVDSEKAEWCQCVVRGLK